MKNKIVTIDDAIKISQEKIHFGKSIILVGGCFDILHIGHIRFLEHAKEKGDLLFVMLESDESIKKSKGPNRPLNPQNDRAIILSSLQMVDYVILLSDAMTNSDYDKLVTELKPAIIATTTGDSNRTHKERQAKLIGAEVLDVTPVIEDQSTTRLVALLNEL